MIHIVSTGYGTHHTYHLRLALNQQRIEILIDRHVPPLASGPSRRCSDTQGLQPQGHNGITGPGLYEQSSVPITWSDIRDVLFHVGYFPN